VQGFVWVVELCFRGHTASVRQLVVGWSTHWVVLGRRAEYLSGDSVWVALL
jgi:hypothetical protein